MPMVYEVETDHAEDELMPIVLNAMFDQLKAATSAQDETAVFRILTRFRLRFGRDFARLVATAFMEATHQQIALIIDGRVYLNLRILITDGNTPPTSRGSDDRSC